jgi:hypothetical protein
MGQLGLERASGKPFDQADKAYLLAPAARAGFLMLQFQVIMKYNPAEAYALAIDIRRPLRGGAPFVQPGRGGTGAVTGRRLGPSNCWSSAASIAAPRMASSAAIREALRGFRPRSGGAGGQLPPRRAGATQGGWLAGSGPKTLNMRFPVYLDRDRPMPVYVGKSARAACSIVSGEDVRPKRIKKSPFSGVHRKRRADRWRLRSRCCWDRRTGVGAVFNFGGF